MSNARDRIIAIACRMLTKRDERRDNEHDGNEQREDVHDDAPTRPTDFAGCVDSVPVLDLGRRNYPISTGMLMQYAADQLSFIAAKGAK